MRIPRAIPPTLRARVAVAAGVLAVMALSLMLNNCWCEQQRWLTRVALVSLVGISFVVELVWGRLPRWAFALSVAAPVGWLIFTDNGSVAGILLLFMVGWIVYTGTLHDGLLAAGLAIAAVLGYVHFDTPDRWLPWIAGILATWLMIRLVVVQQELVQQLRTAQADLERNAVAAERRRIAREIHDVAAHTLAVTMLQLTGVRLLLLRSGGDTRAIEALGEAERLGRQGLDDVRRTVGLLDDSEKSTSSNVVAPLPGADDLTWLVGDYRLAGQEVELVTRGDLAALPPAAGLAVFRIVQEALANVARHAPGSVARVDLDVGEETARLRVTNTSARLDALRVRSAGGSGLGLLGMRERAALLGGMLEAGPDDGGWRVECALPLHRTTGEHAETTSVLVGNVE